ncbi:hypothetical protein [Pacificoceanicola onchidii]|uniref:hypothetical protein n=1 Tax=Pacificoceanicola onchidii TaxID=2562685 RepID=UPI0010A5E552|nr:hypothetical protein [Pacificoceanicola onchidii]
MVSSSKILTVSYGTFSCTAEGFDDPLAVVKETTHFFRGVVGEDRFFGAEPPQFDPEIASELMRAQISAEEQDGKLTLRPALAAGATSSGALAAALSAGAARAEPAAPALPDDDTIEAVAAEAEAEAAAAEAEAEAEAHVEEAVATMADDLAEPDEMLVEAEEESAVDAVASESVDTDDDVALDFDPSVIAGLAADSVAALADDTAQTQPAPDMDAAFDGLVEDEAPAAPARRFSDPGSIADKLDRIRAVVAEAPQDDLEDEDSFDDEAEEDGFLSAQETDKPVAHKDADDAVDLAAISEAATDDAEDAFDLAALDADEDEADDAFDLSALIGEDDSEEEVDPLAALVETVGGPEAADAAFDAWDEDAGEDNAEADDWDWDEDEEEALAQDTPPPPPAPEPEVEAEAEPEAEDLQTRPAPLRARVVKVKRAEFDKAVATGRLEEIEDSAEDTPPPAPLGDYSTLSAEEEDELARELAAVKAELAGDFDEDDWDDVDEDNAYATEASETAEEDWDFEEDAAEEQQPAVAHAAQTPPPPSADGWDDEDDWDDEDEDDWDAHPAAASAAPLRLDNPVTPAPMSEDDDQIDTNIRSAVEDVRKAVKMSSPGRAMLTERSVEDNDTSRILDQTNEELEEPEGNRRRSAIAHLRAAVAATRADKLLSRKSPEAEADEAEAYREDLANAVRPRRPQTSQAPQTRSERPRTEAAQEAERPAPLKLVAEQRIEEVASEPVRPRRIGRDRPMTTTPRAPAAATPEAPVNESDFAAYAEEMGATELSDLLEAAAAYMSFVEGREQFSRPQLMSTVRQAEDRESSREDRLRSFGQLLREGKIEKTSGGRFTASERISFKPERAAG